VPGIDDKKWFGKTKKGFEVLQFSPAEVDQIMLALSVLSLFFSTPSIILDYLNNFLPLHCFNLQGILLLGNLEFEGEDAVKIANEDLLDEIVILLGTVPVHFSFKFPCDPLIVLVLTSLLVFLCLEIFDLLSHVMVLCYQGATKGALVTRLFSAGGRGTAYTVPLTYPQAIENRDALAKV